MDLFYLLFKQFTGVAGVEVGTMDISLSGRIISQFPDRLKPEQQQPDDLALLGEMVLKPDANVIKLPNISASVPQIKGVIEELREQGDDMPNYPEDPQTDEEKQIKPKSIINIPLSISNVIQIIEGLIRDEANKMNDIIIGNFSLDVVGRKISLNKINEKLTEKETEILWKLLNKIDHRIPQKEFLKEIWGYDENIETRTLETHIYRIRKKLNSIGAKDYKINNIDNSYILSLKKLN